MRYSLVIAALLGLASAKYHPVNNYIELAQEQAGQTFEFKQQHQIAHVACKKAMKKPEWANQASWTDAGKMKKCEAIFMQKYQLRGKIRKIQRVGICKKQLSTKLKIADMDEAMKTEFDACLVNVGYAQGCEQVCKAELDLPKRWKLSKLWTGRRKTCIDGCVKETIETVHSAEEAKQVEKQIATLKTEMATKMEEAKNLGENAKADATMEVDAKMRLIKAKKELETHQKIATRADLNAKKEFKISEDVNSAEEYEQETKKAEQRMLNAVAYAKKYVDLVSEDATKVESAFADVTHAQGKMQNDFEMGKKAAIEAFAAEDQLEDLSVDAIEAPEASAVKEFEEKFNAESDGFAVEQKARIAKYENKATSAAKYVVDSGVRNKFAQLALKNSPESKILQKKAQDSARALKEAQDFYAKLTKEVEIARGEMFDKEVQIFKDAQKLKDMKEELEVDAAVEAGSDEPVFFEI